MKKRTIAASVALAALATVSLASCGGTSYKVELVANLEGSTLKVENDKPLKSTYSGSNAKGLLKAVSTIHPEKAGYEFIGWSVDADGTTMITEESDLKTLKAEGKLTDKDANKALEIYANYNAIVMLDGNATGVTGIPETTFKGSNGKNLLEALSSVTPEKTGYTFDGWYTDEDTTNKVENTTKVGELSDNDGDGNLDLYAKWNINQYAIKLNLNDPSLADATEADLNANYNTSVNNPGMPTHVATTASGAEKSFMGWYEDAECTQAVGDKITIPAGGKTIYAKWDIVSISTAEQLLDYLSQSRSINAELTADIDFTGTELKLERTAANLQPIENADGTTTTRLNTNGDGVVVSLNAKFNGNGHTIKGLKIEGDLKQVALWSSLTGTVENVKFESCSVKSTKAGAAFIAAEGKNGATIKNVTFDGLSVEGVASGDGKYAALIQNAKADAGDENAINIENIAMTDVNISGYKYTAALVSQQSTACTVNIKNVLVEANITNADQGVGILVGQVNKAGAVLNVDGAVIAGSITSYEKGEGKNFGAVVGDYKTGDKVSVANTIVTDVKFQLNSKTSTKVGTVIGSIGSGLNYTIADTVKYRALGANLILGKPSEQGRIWYDADKLDERFQGTAVTAANYAAPNEAFTYDAETLTFSLGKASMTVKADQAKAELAVGTVAANMSGPKVDNTKTATLSAGEAAYSIWKVPTIEAAALFNEAGAEGNYLPVIINADASVESLEGAMVISGLKGAVIDATNKQITGYIKITDEDKAAIAADIVAWENGTHAAEAAYIEKSVKVVWTFTDAQIAEVQTYKVYVDMIGISLLEKDADGAIALSTNTLNAVTANPVLVDGKVDPSKLSLISGNINYLTAIRKTGIVIEISRPNWCTVDARTLADTQVDGITIDKTLTTAGKLVGYVAINATGNKTVKVTWDEKHDADAYVISVDTAVVIAEDGSSALIDTLLNASELTVGSINTDSSLFDEIVKVSGGTWSVDENSKTVDGVKYTKRLKSGGARSIEVTTNGAATISFVCVSGSSSDSGRTISPDGNVEAAQAADGTVVKELSFEVDAKGTYKFNISAAINIYGIKITYKTVS